MSISADASQKLVRERTRTEDREHIESWLRDVEPQVHLGLRLGKYFLASEVERIELPRLATEWKEGVLEDQWRSVRHSLRLRRHVLSFFGPRELRAITPSLVRRWQTGLRTHLAHEKLAIEPRLKRWQELKA